MAKTTSETLSLQNPEPEPAEPRYPTDPALWTSRHYLSSLARVERASDVVPDSKFPFFAEMVRDHLAAKLAALAAKKGGA